MVDLKLKDSTVFRTSVFAQFQQLPILKMEEVQGRNVCGRQLVNFILNLINVRPQPITLWYIAITNRSVIQRCATRSRIRTYRIMNVLLRFLHVVFSIVQVTVTTNRDLAGVGRRQT